jgi:hypothetical protein
MSDTPVNDSKPAGNPAPAPAPAPAPVRGHYSGANPIPTVQEFIEKLDMGKKQRDSEVDKKEEKKKVQEKAEIPEAHTPTQPLKAGKGQKVVTDPVTGNEIVIENAKKGMAKESDDPKVS